MDNEKVVVVRDGVAPAVAAMIDKYFVDKCNDDSRVHTGFTSASSTYDEDQYRMVVEAELGSKTSVEMGSRAVERAFEFAEEMLAS